VTTRARPGQQVARDGPIGSREEAWAVAQPWKAGRDAARRWRRGWLGGAAVRARGGGGLLLYAAQTTGGDGGMTRAEMPPCYDTPRPACVRPGRG
jgi:hypothetical protein